MLANALTGLKVLDFTQIAAGPSCTMMLGDLGADVIKIEPPSGDLSRALHPLVEGESVNFMALNRNKRSVVLNLKDEAHAAAALTLVAQADVLVESFGRAGWDIPSPPASMFAWAPLPPALAHLGSLEFSKQLLSHAKVAGAPGVGYGENGEGFVRIAMVENEQRLRQAARNVKRYLASMGVNASAA